MGPTKAPWRFDPSVFVVYGNVTEGDDFIAGMGAVSDEQARVDGRLIAAAPDLLAAARLAVDGHDAIDALVRAIAKAEGPC
tara:strand:- start:233 stop:475 length:243 start_codon:yes stop_codon:yes gene_type:complete